MTNLPITGKEGEEIAANFLIQSGYRILEKNWRYKHKEIDIIAKYNNFLIFVEVKTRKNDFIISPFDAVTLKKQKFIIEAANAFIVKYNIDVEVRFDIVSITYSPKLEIEQIENAFYPKVR